MKRKRRPKGSANVMKRCDCGDPKTCLHPWFARVPAGDGKRRRVNLTEMFPDDPVEVAAAKAMDLARRGRLASNAGTVVTVRDIAKLYRQQRTSKNDVYLDHFVGCAALSAATIGDLKIDQVTTADVKHARDLWGAKRGHDARRHFLQSARHFFNWSVREGYATRTPFLSPQGKALISVPQSRQRSRRVEAGEEDRIRAVGDAFLNDFMTAMLNTGCRPGELRTLQWSEVSEHRITVLAEKAKDRERRTIPILPAVRVVLDRRRRGPDGAKLPPDAYVFGDDTGRLISRERLCERWRATCAKANVDDLHLHDLRAEFASRCVESGVPIHEVREALGHSSVVMTDIYLRSRIDTLDNAYARLDQHQRRKRLKVVALHGKVTMGSKSA